MAVQGDGTSYLSLDTNFTQGANDDVSVHFFINPNAAPSGANYRQPYAFATTGNSIRRRFFWNHATAANRNAFEDNSANPIQLTPAPSADTWTGVGYSEDSSTSTNNVEIYQGGANDTPATNDWGDPGSTLGRVFAFGVPAAQHQVRLAEFAMWSVVLTDDEFAILGAGYSPLFVRPQSLVLYAPMWEESTVGLQLISGEGQFTENGTGFTTVAHPPIIYPSNQTVNTPASSGHALLANDLESISQVGVPSLAQAQVLLANDVESAANLSAPALGQIHGLTSTSIESISQLSLPALSQNTADHTLLANDISSLTETNTPSIGQVHALSANDVQAQAEVSIDGAFMDGVMSEDEWWTRRRALYRTDNRRKHRR